MLSKDATLATTKLSKIVRAPRQARRYPVTSYRVHPSNNQQGRLANGQRPTRQLQSLLERGCLTSLWPLAVATPPMSMIGPFGGTQNITVRERPCQMLCKIDFTPVQLADKGQIFELILPRIATESAVKIGNSHQLRCHYCHFSQPAMCQYADGAADYECHQQPNGKPQQRRRNATSCH